MIRRPWRNVQSMGDKAGANDRKLIRGRVECCSISLVLIEARGEPANDLETGPQPRFCCLFICRSWNLGKKTL